MGVLLPKIKPLIYSNGGPVITVQVRSKNWMHYDLKFTYLPKATYYYIRDLKIPWTNTAAKRNAHEHKI